MLKIITDLLPLICFFIAYKAYEIIFATKTLLITTITCFIIQHFFCKKADKLQFFLVLAVIFFSSITIYSNDPKFIKIKPTIVYSTLGIGLSYCAFKKYFFIKTLIKQLFSHIDPNINLNDITDQKWRNITLTWALFFFLCAILNEIIWRNYDTKVWIHFKVWGYTIMLFTFLVTQVIYISSIQNKKNKS